MPHFGFIFWTFQGVFDFKLGNFGNLKVFRVLKTHISGNICDSRGDYVWAPHKCIVWENRGWWLMFFSEKIPKCTYFGIHRIPHIKRTIWGSKTDAVPHPDRTPISEPNSLTNWRFRAHQQNSEILDKDSWFFSKKYKNVLNSVIIEIAI